MTKPSRVCCLASTLLLCATVAGAQGVTATARVSLSSGGKGGKGSANVVLWLDPVGAAPSPIVMAAAFPAHPQLVQKNKMFHPHLLIVPVGAVVEFPNRDPFFHNVFSLYEGKRFDLGLYEAGSSRRVVFDKPGISYIFCDIHAQMSAVVIALATPYYAVSDERGQILIPHVPTGRYRMHLWYEAALPEQLNAITREVEISGDRSTLGVFRLMRAALPSSHKNKYGKDYDPPTPDNPAYSQP
jgi:plastocyanin